MQATPEPIAAVSQRLDQFLTERIEEARQSGELAHDFARRAAACVTGGKRLRAAFCLDGFRAVADAAHLSPGDGVRAAALAAASSLEVFQAAALVHDDLVDNSDTRRGRPAAHRSLEADHRGRGWAGDAQAHGRSAAILLGDLLVAWSDDLFEEDLGLAPAGAAAASRAEYARMRRDVTIGQYLDVAEESAHITTPATEQLARALAIASHKSARYSVQQPLLIGATLAEASEQQRGALDAFGHAIGMAFQLRDDVLGVFGDAQVTGKPAGDDLREGKRTVLVALTRERLPGPVLRTFDELVGDPSLSAAQIDILRTAILDSGALDRVEALIADYRRDAERALAGAPLGSAAVSSLRDLGRRASQRTS